MTTQRDWVIARSKPQREAWAVENIDRYHHRPVYCPRYRDERTNRIKVLFPTYIFIYCPDLHFHFLKGTFGLSHVVMQGKGPARMSNKIIDAMRAQHDEDDLVVLPSAPKQLYALNQPLELTDGPFIHRIGLYQGQSVSGRIMVLLNLLGRKVTTHVDQTHVRALS